MKSLITYILPQISPGWIFKTEGDDCGLDSSGSGQRPVMDSSDHDDDYWLLKKDSVPWGLKRTVRYVTSVTCI